MRRTRMFFVYILASKRNGTLYVGVTGDLARRVAQHRRGSGSRFVAKYSVHRLVYYESCPEPYSAITREKQLKKWLRKWKLELIERHNPDWIDLFDGHAIRPLPRS